MIVVIKVPPKAGFVCKRQRSSGLISSPMQSAVNPTLKPTAILEANDLLNDVAGNNRISG